MKYEAVCANQAIGVYMLSELKELAALESTQFGKFDIPNHNGVFRDYVNYRVLSYCKKVGFYNQPQHLANPIPGTDVLLQVLRSNTSRSKLLHLSAVNNGLDWD